MCWLCERHFASVWSTRAFQLGAREKETPTAKWDYLDVDGKMDKLQWNSFSFRCHLIMAIVHHETVLHANHLRLFDTQSGKKVLYAIYARHDYIFFLKLMSTMHSKSKVTSDCHQNVLEMMIFFSLHIGQDVLKH